MLLATGGTRDFFIRQGESVYQLHSHQLLKTKTLSANSVKKDAYNVNSFSGRGNNWNVSDNWWSKVRTNLKQRIYKTASINWVNKRTTSGTDNSWTKKNKNIIYELLLTYETLYAIWKKNK